MRTYPNLESHYLPHVVATRGRMYNDPRILTLVGKELDEAELLAFLLHFCAFGVRMVEPVEGWIRRAGHAVIRKGRLGLGADIALRAIEEAGHDQLMLEDFFALVREWRQRFHGTIDTEELLRQPPPNAVLRYADLHEAIIAGPHPWAQLGVELEIENMSTVIGPPMLGCCAETLGGDISGALSFVREHVELDVGHSQNNASRLDELLAREPDLGWPIARAGTEALAIYLEFLGDCVDLGREFVSRSAHVSAHG